jgi:5-methylcytosine-specific restriction protein A
MAANSSRGRPWRRLQAQILQRDHYLCQMRGPRCTTHATTVDHILPKSRGGTDHPNNLRAACAPCNYAGGARITNTTRRGRKPRPVRLPTAIRDWG